VTLKTIFLMLSFPFHKINELSITITGKEIEWKVTGCKKRVCMSLAVPGFVAGH
jgi:hypothetical protein